MKRGIAALVLVAFALTGCAASPKAESLKESDFFKMSRELDDPLFASMDDATLTKLGKGACDILRSGGDDGWLLNIKTLTDHDVDAKAAGGFVAYATATYCIDLMDKLPAS